jgi:hypothetical protein
MSEALTVSLVCAGSSNDTSEYSNKCYPYCGTWRIQHSSSAISSVGFNCSSQRWKQQEVSVTFEFPVVFGPRANLRSHVFWRTTALGGDFPVERYDAQRTIVTRSLPSAFFCKESLLEGGRTCSVSLVCQQHGKKGTVKTHGKKSDKQSDNKSENKSSKPSDSKSERRGDHGGWTPRNCTALLFVGAPRSHAECVVAALCGYDQRFIEGKRQAKLVYNEGLTTFKEKAKSTERKSLSNSVLEAESATFQLLPRALAVLVSSYISTPLVVERDVRIIRAVCS